MLRFATSSLQALVMLLGMLLGMLLSMLRYARDRLLEFRDAPTEVPEEVLNSGIGVLTKEDESVHNPESLRNRSNSSHQLQKDECTAELSPAIAKKDHENLGMGDCLGGQSEKEKDEIYGRKEMHSELQGILSKLEVSQDYALLARQEGILTVETLRGVMSLIFENAAMHSAQCSMYAQMCVLLSKMELLDFPGDKTITSLSVVLNMCQDEFEKLTKPEQAVERDDENEKRVKLRKVGIVKLIGELFNENLLPEKIVHECIQELLGSGQDPKAFPVEENVEVLCLFLRTVGKQLEESPKSKMAIDTYFARLTVIRKSTVLSSRIQQMVRSVFDLRSKKWVSPQEEVKAKKINKIRAKAKSSQRTETMALRKASPAAPPKLLPGGRGTTPGMSAVPSILGRPGMPGGRGPVQLVDERRKASMDKESLLSVPVPSDLAKGMEFGVGTGVGRAAAMPKPKPGVRDHLGVRANKDNFNLRDLSQRVQMFNK